MRDWRDDTSEILRRAYTEDVSSLMFEVDRNDRPLVLWTAWDAGRLSVDELVEFIPEAWVGAEWPIGAIGERAWLAMFKAAGYVWQVYSSDDGAGGFREDIDMTRQPDHPLTVYRGGRKARAMSWTVDIERARWFADRTAWFGSPSSVFKATVPGRAVLAMFNDRAEQEVVVNPNMLRNRVEVVETRQLKAPGSSSVAGGPFSAYRTGVDLQ